jgi:hypothetical protein
LEKIELTNIDELKKSQPHLCTVEKGFIVNDFYRVLIAKTDKYIHLRIRRIDDKPITSFQDMQDIKNEFIGKERAAIQVYPKESDYINNTNSYHLFSWDNMEIPNLATMYTYK